MKKTMTILMVLAAQFGLATNLMAATGVREDSSSILVWAFLVICALIVIVQLMPAMVLAFGLIKTVFTDEKGSEIKVQVSSEV